MEYPTGFRGQGWHRLPASVREQFWEALGSGLSPTAAATVAGVHGATGRKWAKDAGYVTDTRHRGVRYGAAVRAVFWQAVRGGESPTEAAVIAGVSETSARHWLDQAGYVPRTLMPADVVVDLAAPDRLMSFVERCHLEDLLEAGHRPAGAARLLGRDRATIHREIKKGVTGSGYRARVAQRVVEANRRRPKPRRLEANDALLVEVLRRLKQRHSPQQIAGRLREEFPEDPEMWVSHETIYQALYVQPRGELARLVKTALRSGRTRRKPQGRNDTGNQGRLKDMINISERPAEAADRAIPGHWESQWCCQAAWASAGGVAA